MCGKGGFELVVLVKPQFEVGRENVGKGGIVRDADAQQMAVERVKAAVRELGGSRDRSHRVPNFGRGREPGVPVARAVLMVVEKQIPRGVKSRGNAKTVA